METDILNNINTEETWIDVETLAKLKNVTKRAVRISINNYIRYLTHLKLLNISHLIMKITKEKRLS